MVGWTRHALPAGAYTVVYPVSGEHVMVIGQPRAGLIDDDQFAVGFLVAQAIEVRGNRVPRGGVLMIDPRCGVWSEEDDQLAYDPRLYADVMSTEMAAWLERHPDWPPDRKPQRSRR